MEINLRFLMEFDVENLDDVQNVEKSFFKV